MIFGGPWGGGTPDIQITNCLFLGHGTPYESVGIGATLTHCTMVADPALTAFENGNGQSSCAVADRDGDSAITVQNCLVLGYEGVILANDGSVPVGAVELTNHVCDNLNGGDPDPEVIDPAVWDAAAYVTGTGDFRPAPTSPCLGAGTDLGVIEDINGGLRPAGDASPDVGAYDVLDLDVSIWEIY